MADFRAVAEGLTEHRLDDDPFFSCPKAVDHEGPCDCGYDKRVREIEAALQAAYDLGAHDATFQD